MLELDIKLAESYDEKTNKFTATTTRVQLEHSLVSVSKWESFWEIPFLGKGNKTTEQTVSYVQMMIVGDQPSPEVFHELFANHIEQINNYIGAKMTATILPETKQSGRPETITAELIYYWMVSMRIPVEFENWHLNRLITLVRVITIKQAPQKNKKMTKSDMEARRALNRQRLAQG